MNKLENKSIEWILANSEYKLLSWFDRANGNNLTQSFDNLEIINKQILVKSLKLIPYAFSQSNILWNSTSGDVFSVPPNARLTNVIDTFTTSARINVLINGARASFLPSVSNQAYPLDLFIDNIYYQFKAKIQSIDVNVQGDIFFDLPGTNTENPLIKVLMECYLF